MCDFPMNAISYAVFCLKKETSGNRAGILPSTFDTAPVVCEYIPVNIVAREGRHKAFTTNALRNVHPSWPMRSMFGVCVSLFPVEESSSQRSPSPRMQMMFGLSLSLLRAGAKDSRLSWGIG